MACLHRFVPHPALELLFCEHCAATRSFAQAQAEGKPKKEKTAVVKTADVDAAVAKFLEEKLAQNPEPVQEELFAPPGLDVADMLLYRQKVAEAEERAARAEHVTDETPGYFDPNMPDGMPWTSTAGS